MWSFHISPQPKTQGLQVVIEKDSQRASVDDVIHAFKDDESFRGGWNTTLAETNFTAFRWETPPVTMATKARSFECVLLDDPRLARIPDSSSFAEYFPHAIAGVAVFPNLRKDATLLVPCPLTKTSAYGHLAAFVRDAPLIQRDAFWKRVGETWGQCINSSPIWLNTAGAGVPWLHVRFDSFPKYYWHGPYRTAS